MVKNTNKKGFTIIEVVLVLAIAGLIFLMVFIALPALQRSQRNTQRENDISRFMTEMNNYRTNNGNKTPFQALLTSYVKGDAVLTAKKPTTTAAATYTDVTSETSVANYINKYIKGGTSDDSKFSDPNGNAYKFSLMKTPISGTTGAVVSAGITGTAVDNVIYVNTNARCSDTEGSIIKTNGAGDTAYMYIMEGGSIYCISN